MRTSDAPSVLPTLDPTCQEVPSALADRIGYALANDPRHIVKVVAVEAPTSESGPWLVAAAETAGIYDDGTIDDDEDEWVTELVLVSADGPPAKATVIEIGGRRRDVRGNWHNVSWDREMREQGERAAENALVCLDQIGP